jgi:hypothetical protein
MKSLAMMVLVLLLSHPAFSADSDQERLFNVRKAVVAGLDSLAPSCLEDQNLEPGDIRRGRFHNSDNMRMQEVTLVLAFLYSEPLSKYHGRQDVLGSVLLSLDYMVRAQGSNGGFNEYHGWCGVPNRQEGKSSVTGFTLHSICRSLMLLNGDSAFQSRLEEAIDTDGDGEADASRHTAYASMLAKAMPAQFEGPGRGHAPNQDIGALVAVIDLNEAYRKLMPGKPPLKTLKEIHALRDEVFLARPMSPAKSPPGRWFSSKGMILEPGHGGTGYDANYAGVSLHFMGLSGRDDPSIAQYSKRLWNGFQYFFVVENGVPKTELGIARRQEGILGSISPCYAGLTARCHPAANRVYGLILKQFESDPAPFFRFASPHQFQYAAYSYVDWLLNLELPKASTYRLPCERTEPFRYEDKEAGILVLKPENGVPTWWARPWDAEDQVRRHVYGGLPETLPASGWPK